MMQRNEHQSNGAAQARKGQSSSRLASQWPHDMSQFP